MARKKKPTADDLLKSKKRDKKRKGLRLQRKLARNVLTTKLRSDRAFANVVAIRQGPRFSRDTATETPGQIVFGMRTGLFGHPTTTVLRIPYDQIVGATEDMKEMGEIVTKLGLLTLGALLNYNLTGGPEGMAKALAEWAEIDLEALRKEAAADEKEGPTSEPSIQAPGDFPIESAIDAVPVAPVAEPLLGQDDTGAE